MENVVVDDLLEFNFTEVDNKEFELHLQNKGIEQPDNITGQDQLRRKGVVLCGRLVEAVHGEIKGQKDGDYPCTLAIFEWYVHTRKPGMRIKFARIDISFKSSKGVSKYNPWIENCAPWGAYSLFETERTLEKTKGWQPSIKLGQEGIVNAEFPFVYELKETTDREEQIYVDGCPLPPQDGTYFHPDRFSAVQWNLFENKGQRSGIPRYFRTAVLLNRVESSNECFTADISIKVKVSTFEDTKERVKSFLGLNIKDDPLMFNPALKPKTNRFNGKIDDLEFPNIKLEDEMGFLLFRNRAVGKNKTESKEVTEGAAPSEVSTS
ncbi:hypothetical protein AAE478_007494 [Parahypoxylon ruwenzoriense]